MSSILPLLISTVSATVVSYIFLGNGAVFASDLGVKVWQVENTVELLSQGATVPFISRYRKERTGSLDDVAVAQIKHLAEDFDVMEKRKAGILETISAAGALTDELRAQIEECIEPDVLEDLYLPYRPKRRTRATAAREAGYEPLADKMWNNSTPDPHREFLR